MMIITKRTIGTWMNDTPELIEAAGIDYSMNSPAVCVFKGAPKHFGFSNCQIFSLSTNKKVHGVAKNISISPFPFYNSFTERYNNISEWVLSSLQTLDKPLVFLEGYAYAGSGMLFNIGENTGLLKYKLWNREIPVEIFAPSSIKKTASGKGNSNKTALETCFRNQEGIEIKKMIGQSERSDNPSSDIIDSFYILKHGLKIKGWI